MTLAVPREFESANTQTLARLQERHKRIIDANANAFCAKTVLDLACNNGRWSYAALNAGATKVVGVEGRADKVAEARSIFERLAKSSGYEFHVGDMYDWLHDNKSQRFDTVMCLGVFYHIMDHHRLLSSIARLQPRTIIVDSGFVRSFRNSVHVQTENPNEHRNALPKYKYQTSEFAGFISLGLMIQMSWNLGYNCRPVVWDPRDVENKPSVQDYLMGRRFTIRLERTDSHVDSDWMEYWRPALVILNDKFSLLFDRKTHDAMTDHRVRKPFDSMGYSIM